jgi:parvulin-like peptidyl-prolyl isomerase
MRQNFGKHMKVLLVLIAGGFVVGVFTTYGSNVSRNRQQQQKDLSGAVAVVNGQAISRQAYQTILDNQLEQAKQYGSIISAVQRAQMMGQTLDSMIDQQIRLQAAEKEGVKVGRRDINRKIDQMVEDQVNILKQRYAGKKKLSEDEIDSLMEKTPFTLPYQDSSGVMGARKITSLGELRDALRDQLDRNSVKAQLMIEGLDKLLTNRFSRVTDQEWMDSYRQVRARHILISNSKLPDEQARRRAEEVLRKLKAGGDFAALAREFSDDPGSKDKGGELGFFSKGQMVPEFDKAAFSLKPGQLSGIVKTQYGYHIIQVEETRQQLPKDFEKNKKKLRDDFARSQADSKKAQYYQDLRKRSRIVINDPELRGYEAAMDAFRSPSPSERDKKLVEAMRDYERATRDNNSPTAWVMLAQIHMQKGEKDQAKKIYESLLTGKDAIEDLDVRMALGQIYMDEKQNDKAVEMFKVASDLAFNNPQVSYQLVSDFKQLGRADLAAQEQKKVDEWMKQMQASQPTQTPPPSNAPAKSERRRAGG